MSLQSILSKLFGNKSQRDLKEIQPIVDKINAIGPSLKSLSNDELRGKIDQVRAEIDAAVKPDRDAAAEIRAKVEDLPFDERQPLWDEIDKHEKNILDILEEQLNTHLPIVFATMRETAARFAANDTVEVTATEMDRDLAAQGREFVTIEGDKAIWKNRWLAGGNEIKWDMVHYDVQLIGGVVLHQGKIAEMATGEGKTLVATLPVFLRSLSKKGVHVVTVNDYLSKRDSEWMGPLYMFHGSTVDCIDKHQPNSEARRKAYMADITFGTNNEYGFDYLRDNMASSPKDLVQRKHHFAIVDEVDSVLIDDARTPLIISGPVPKGDDQYFNDYKANVEKVVQAQRKLVTSILAEAKTKLASDDKAVRKEGALLLFRAYKGLPKNGALIKFLSQEGMKNTMLQTEAYYLQDNAREMPVVTDPLYFVIDEKNRSVELTDKGLDELTGKINDPQFFVLPDIASQLSELEHEPDTPERAEKKDALMADYAVKAERVHTVTQLLKAYTLFEKDVEYVIDDNKIKIVDEQTGRIMEGRRYSDGLHQAIEAKEGVKVEAATQTFATITLQNYFRMYHKLAGMTGTASTEAGELWDIYKLDVVTIPTNRPVARIDMNDRVYKTKREKYAAVIEEIERLVGEGRPVLVGTTSVEISELLSRMLTGRRIPHNVLNAKLHQREAEIVALAGRTGTVTIATNMAGRGTDIMLGGNAEYLAKAQLRREGMTEEQISNATAFGETKDEEILAARKRFGELMAQYKEEIAPEAEKVRQAGGLFILGTERHESRRIDNQLRGRAGRQGDPGESRFYLSLDDDLMRLFGGDRITGLMERMDLGEDMPIESKMLTKGIENAQTSVESRNFQSRKSTLEYDDVMNKQREIIYGQRKQVLDGMDIRDVIVNMISSIITSAVTTAFGDQKRLDDEGRRTMLSSLEGTFFPRNTFQPTDEALAAAGPEQLIEMFTGKAMEFYAAKEAEIAKAKEANPNFPDMRELERVVMLQVVDEYWMEHIDAMQDLRQGIRLRAYAQSNPVDAYKAESLHMFEEMISAIQEETVRRLYSVRLKTNQEVKRERVATGITEGRGDGTVKKQPRRVQKVGRNDPCPCGSGKKYKHCCGRDA